MPFPSAAGESTRRAAGPTGGRCIIARIGFLSDPAKGGRATYEVYDSGMSYRDCSGKRTLDDVVTWLESAKIVEPSYNRVR